ncbi:MAG: proprotein convertase P-domain-containing protein [Gemmataceae bacterium]
MRLSGIWSRLTTRLKKRVQEKRQAAKRLQLERLSLETLEERTLLTVAPPPIVPDTPAIINASGNAHSPILAADPTNPNNIVAVYSQFSFTETPQNVPVYRIRGAYSSDGGQTWTNFAPMGGYNNRQTFRPFHHASTPSITWDREGNFYVVATITDDAQYVGGTAAGATPTAGVLVLSKYQFDPSGPTQEFENILHEWYLQEPIYNPVVAIDNNVPSYTDPTTGQTMTDTMAGKALYVAWNTNTQNPEANRGGNGIRLMASVDGGNTFTTPVWVNTQIDPVSNTLNGGPSNSAISGPQILFTQGSLDGTVESGRMVVAWTNGGSIQIDNTRPDGGVLGTRVADNVSLHNNGAFIVDAVNNVTATTDVVVYVNDVDDRANVLNAAQLANSVFVNINTIDKNFDIVRDLDVSFTLLHPSLNALSAQIVKLDTNGNFDRSATLWTNRTDNAGQNDQFNRGLPQGANMGTLVDVNTNIRQVGLTFDQQAAVDVRAGGITNGTYQYIGRYRPEQSVFGFSNYDTGGLNVFNDMTRDDLRGAWILRFRDFRTDGGTPPPPTFVSDVEFKFSAHIDTNYFGEDFTVGGAQANTSNNLPGNTPPAAPNGTAPTIRLAQDNSLGAFSPYQGRVYLVYTGGAGTDTDIFFTYDDNAGQGVVNPLTGTTSGWTGFSRFINDDFIFGQNSDKLNSTGLRSQFTPAIAVDQVTGSVVVSWYDARYDANNWRVATMVSVSVDGGETFSRQDRQGNYSADNDQASYLNESKTAIDAITGKTIVIEPIPSNMSVAGTPTINGRPQGFGYQMGLVAHNGRLTAVWAGNQNMPGSSIYANNAYYAAGPRIIDTDSGPVIEDFEIELTENDGFDTPYKTVTYNTSFGPDGRRRLDSIVVTFDRPIDATTFTPDDVQVMFRSPNTPASVAPTPVLVASVEALNDDRPQGFGVREISAPGEFASVFRIVFQTPQSAVGTYSLAVGPDIRDRIRKPQIVVTPSGSSVTGSVSPATDIPDDGTLYTSTISVTGSPVDEVISSLTVNVQISGAYHSDLVLTLVAPDGTRVVLANRQGGPSTSAIDTTFDDAAFEYIKLNGYSFQVRPEAPLATLVGKVADGDWVLEIVDLGTGDVATLDSWSLDIATGTTNAVDNLGNLMDQDADGTSGETATYDNDTFANPKPINGRPFELPYVENTLPLIIPGPYVTSVNVTGQASTADNVAIDKTVSSIDVKFDRDIKPSTFTAADIIRVVGPLGQITPIPTIVRYQWFGTTANNLNRLQVSFSQTIDRSTLTAADIRLISPSGAVLPITSITPVAGSGDTTFDIAFPLQTAAGTYNANIGPAVSNRLGYSMLSWNGTGTITAASNVPVIVAAEWAGSGVNNLVRLRVTFNRDMDGSTFGPGDIQLRGPNGQVINVTSVTEVLGSNGRSFDIVIPAQVSAGAYTATIGPNVNSSTNVRMAVWTGTFKLAPDFTITQIGNSKRDYRITFPTDASGNVLAQSVNGQYSVVLGSDIQSDLTNERMDANHNAGLGTLRGTIDPDQGVQASSEYNWGQLPTNIAAGSTLTAALNINDAFLIQNLTIKFTITTPNVQNLIATLVGPDGTTIQLFDGLNLQPGANFISTVLSDTATTAIQNALAPFTGTYNPQKPLGTFNGKGSNGAWKLVLRNRSTSGQSATLNSWSLAMQSVTPGTGLGEPVADQSTATFRIFTMDVLNPASRNNWTAVGPVANNNEANAGQVTNVQLDPSDPSGNTAYAVGAHSGIWKTTNFMTTAVGGPTWIPLTDFGPSNGISIGSLVLIPRNNDPNRTIVLAGTGSGANIVSSGAGYANQGIGFLRSEDGGANWKVLDSLTNFDAQGVYIPLSSATRTREFDDTLSFRLVVDPNLNPLTNESIVYAAMSGTKGGLYRSTDSGKNWTLLRAGQATDVALSQTQKGTAGFVEQYGPPSRAKVSTSPRMAVRTSHSPRECRGARTFGTGTGTILTTAKFRLLILPNYPMEPKDASRWPPRLAKITRFSIPSIAAGSTRLCRRLTATSTGCTSARISVGTGPR